MEILNYFAGFFKVFVNIRERANKQTRNPNLLSIANILATSILSTPKHEQKIESEIKYYNNYTKTKQLFAMFIILIKFYFYSLLLTLLIIF